MSRHTKNWRNSCSQCGYSWYPRGHAVSASCPHCGSGQVSTPGLSGCLYVFGAGVLFILFLVILGTFGPYVFGGLGALGVGGFIGVKVLQSRSRQAKALALQQEQQAQWTHQQGWQRQEAEKQRLYEEQQRREREERLVATFGEEGAASILRRKLWVGAPEQVAIEIFGSADDVEEKVLKTKSKRILKYRDPAHATRYSVKVTVENGAVIGWEDRDG